MKKISTIIVVKGNPMHLMEAVRSVSEWVNEIIIIDLGLESILKTKLKTFPKISFRTLKKDVPYVELIREEVKKYAKNDWLFYLDPDEVVPSSLAKKLIATNGYDYVSMPRKNIIFGKWLIHSRWWPDYQVRLFKKDSVTWPKVIHQQPDASGKGLVLEATEELALEHFNYETLDEYMDKARRYAKSEASWYHHQKKPITLQEALSKGLSEFISRYFSDEGYKDGFHGMMLSLLQLFYYYLVYAYYWEDSKFAEIEKKPREATQWFFKSGYFQINYWLIQKKLIPFGKRVKNKLINKLVGSSL